MSGGGGGAFGRRRWSSELADTVSSRVAAASYEAEASDYLRELLRTFNSRDAEGIRTHLDDITATIEADLDGTVDLEFGGSVRKHTYVDGLSDVDTLLIVNRTSLAHATPNEVLAFVQQRLETTLPGAKVTTGALAVTVNFADGAQVQILPAIKTATGVRIADGRGNWSPVVRPSGFAAKLTAMNKANSGQVVPAIKLFKGIQQTLPSSLRLSGYHVESLAIEAFRNYEGPRTPRAMLRHLVREAAARVDQPIRDQTGQSRHVDDYLGPAGSVERGRVEAALKRLSERVDAADQSRSLDLFKGLFGD